MNSSYYFIHKNYVRVNWYKVLKEKNQDSKDEQIDGQLTELLKNCANK